MAKEQTLGIIKPDGVSRNLIGEIFRRVEKSGLKIVAAKMLRLDKAKAEGFYAVHKGKPFFDPLVGYMTTGPVLTFVIEGEGAIAKWRDTMGATNPANAAPGTIRKDFAENIERNTVHGSDAPETAKFEVGYFFKENEIFSK
ncbi:MAG: nucleoside-diphosphate kinase [Deltaproteobacteria bacterium]|nr:nucleoside-diphosphate kinase [Deltaproteobacteria bacterium]